MAQFVIPGKIYDIKGSFPRPDFSKFIGKNIMCFGVSVKNSDEVFVQLAPTVTNSLLEKMENVTFDHGNYPKVKNFASGSPLLAYFAKDEGLYRVRMLEKIDETKSRVYFVDYGNIEIIPNNHLMDCPGDLIDYVEGATECFLSGFHGEESEEELKFLQETIEEKDFEARIEKVHSVLSGGTLLTILTEKGDWKYNLEAPQIQDQVDCAATSKRKVAENKNYLATDDGMKSKLVRLETNNNNNNNLMEEKVAQLQAEYGKKLMEKEKEIKFCYEQRQEETKLANTEISVLKAKISGLQNELSTVKASGVKQDNDGSKNPYSEMKSRLEKIQLYLMNKPASSSSSGGSILSKSETLLVERNKDLDKLIKNILEVLSHLMSSFKAEKEDDEEHYLPLQKELNETKQELAKVKQELENLRSSRM